MLDNDTIPLFCGSAHGTQYIIETVIHDFLSQAAKCLDGIFVNVTSVKLVYELWEIFCLPTNHNLHQARFQLFEDSSININEAKGKVWPIAKGMHSAHYNSTIYRMAVIGCWWLLLVFLRSNLLHCSQEASHHMEVPPKPLCVSIFDGVLVNHIAKYDCEKQRNKPVMATSKLHCILRRYARLIMKKCWYIVGDIVWHVDLVILAYNSTMY